MNITLSNSKGNKKKAKKTSSRPIVERFLKAFSRQAIRGETRRKSGLLEAKLEIQAGRNEVASLLEAEALPEVRFVFNGLGLPGDVSYYLGQCVEDIKPHLCAIKEEISMPWLQSPDTLGELFEAAEGEILAGQIIGYLGPEKKFCVGIASPLWEDALNASLKSCKGEIYEMALEESKAGCQGVTENTVGGIGAGGAPNIQGYTVPLTREVEIKLPGDDFYKGSQSKRAKKNREKSRKKTSKKSS